MNNTMQKNHSVTRGKERGKLHENKSSTDYALYTGIRYLRYPAWNVAAFCDSIPGLHSGFRLRSQACSVDKINNLNNWEFILNLVYFGCIR